MSSSSIKAPQQKSNEESLELQYETNADLVEDSKKNSGKDSENEKPQSPEVVLNIEESMQEHLKTGSSNKNFLLYECQTNPVPRKKVPTTLVYFGRQITPYIEPTGDPLEYTSDRNDFVRLVMILVFIMISTTAACLTIVFIVDELKEFCQEHGVMLAIIGMVITLGVTYAIACSSCTRIFPCNIICLFITVIGMTIICAFITVRYETELVLLAVAATAGVVLVCFLIALTSFDFTSFMLYLMVISAALGIVTLVFFIYTMITGHYMKWVHFGILAASTVFSSVIFGCLLPSSLHSLPFEYDFAQSSTFLFLWKNVLIMELQMILGGKAVQLSEDDYALGAFMVYTSIIDIFLKILQMLGILDSIGD